MPQTVATNTFFQLLLIPFLFQFYLLTPSGGFAATSLKEGGGM